MAATHDCCGRQDRTEGGSLIETCKLIGVEPYRYLADIIARIADSHPNSRLDELLPWAHAAAPELKAVA